MKHEPDIIATDDQGERSTRRAMVRGWRRRCPRCGGGLMFDGYLKVRDTCASCGQKLSHHQADDMPAWATIMVVGHLVIPAMVSVEMTWSPPLWVHWIAWPVLTLLLCLLLLPRIKGSVVGMQWALKMHGFDTDDE